MANYARLPAIILPRSVYRYCRARHCRHFFRWRWCVRRSIVWSAATRLRPPSCRHGGGNGGNHRIQVFDGDGNFKRQIVIDVPVPPGAKPAIGNIPSEAQIAGGTMAPGSPWAICITPGPNQVLYSADAWPGRIYKLSLDGKVLGMLGQSGKQLKQFGWIHELACPSENVVWAGELLNWRAQKLILHP